MFIHTYAQNTNTSITIRTECRRCYCCCYYYYYCSSTADFALVGPRLERVAVTVAAVRSTRRERRPLPRRQTVGNVRGNKANWWITASGGAPPSAVHLPLRGHPHPQGFFLFMRPLRRGVFFPFAVPVAAVCHFSRWPPKKTSVRLFIYCARIRVLFLPHLRLLFFPSTLPPLLPLTLFYNTTIPIYNMYVRDFGIFLRWRPNFARI